MERISAETTTSMSEYTTPRNLSSLKTYLWRVILGTHGRLEMVSSQIKGISIYDGKVPPALRIFLASHFNIPRTPCRLQITNTILTILLVVRVIIRRTLSHRPTIIISISVLIITRWNGHRNFSMRV